jgi:hypothetical protein
VSVEVKIHVKKLTNTPEFAQETLILASGNAQGNSVYSNYTYTQLNAFQALFGLKGRKLYWNKISDGTWHYATIQGWIPSTSSPDGAWILTSTWFYATPDQPSNDYIVNITRPYANRYILFSPLFTYDATNDLLEQDLLVVQQVERGDTFNLETSYGSVKIYGSDAMKSMMATYWSEFVGDYKIAFEVEIFYNGTRELFGLSKIEDITYDVIGNVYEFSIYDYLPFMLGTIGSSPSPSATPDATGTYFSITQFLYDTLQACASIDPDVQVVGSENMNYNEYLSYNITDPLNVTTEIRSVTEEMDLRTFLLEMQKHYGAYLFYNQQTKNICFYNRNITVGELNIDDLIIEDTFERSYGERTYEGLIVNATEVDGAWTWTGFAKVRINADSTMSTERVVSEEEISSLKNYLDLRQDFPYQGFTWYVFEIRDPAQRFTDYKELLLQPLTYKCVINTTSIQLLNKVIYQGGWYTVKRIEKNFLEGKSTIEISQIITTYPNPFD